MSGAETLLYLEPVPKQSDFQETAKLLMVVGPGFNCDGDFWLKFGSLRSGPPFFESPGHRDPSIAARKDWQGAARRFVWLGGALCLPSPLLLAFASTFSLLGQSLARKQAHIVRQHHPVQFLSLRFQPLR